MSVARDQLGDDHRSNEETIDIKTLLKMIVESQTNQAETQAKQAESQQQIIEILRSTIIAGNNHKQQEEDIGTNLRKQEIMDADDKELGNYRDNGLLGGKPEIEGLQTESEEKLAKCQARKEKSEENIIQSPTLEVRRSINTGANNTQQAEKVFRAKYKPDRNDLLLEGDCKKTIEFLKNNPEALTQGVTRSSNNVLHVAIYKRREMVLIEEIVNLMSPELLEYTGGDYDFTALHYAAQYGNAEAVVLLVNKNPRLPLILDNRRFTPLDIALRNVSIDQKEIAEYLYSVTKDVDPSPFSGSNGAYTLCRSIEANFYDLALRVVLKFPEAATTKSNGTCGLEMMVQRPFAFKSGAKLTWWQNLIYSLIQVDANALCIRPVEPATIRDEENPVPENLDSTKVEESSKASSTNTYVGIIMPYLTRGNSLRYYLDFNFFTEVLNRAPETPMLLTPSAIYKYSNVKSLILMVALFDSISAIGIKYLYNQKLVHQQATALIKQIIVEICKYTTLLWFLNNYPNTMKTAIKHGIVEVVAECLEKNGNLIWDRISGEKMIEMAITERKEMIVNLLCETGDKLKDKLDLVSRTDLEQNTILHYAAKLAPFAQLNLVSGAALQMQRELQWFKGIESMLRESDRFTRNKKGDTAQFIFTEAHKDLVKEGQDWLKDTSGSCMIVGALIATVAFAAAFTVPGGNISDSNIAMKGTPIFLGKSSFTVFAVSDALALSSSITSVLMFLAIYTSRYSEMDFLKSLPQKLIFGLATLFISMVAILVAFGASLFIVVGSRFSHALIPITLITCFPLGLFAWLQLPLFVEMVRSTYWGSLFKKHEHIDFSSMKNDNKTRKKKKGN
ncbi:hypothetical protein MKX03_031448 [Papaver bracteatum]|nr:hypothetical protein MKX03_031448 [Papaver bracteatum]